jgi:formiminotetrahydrofolate cyclodeaminase
MYVTAVTIRDQSIHGWLSDLASRSPTPGGGAVAALCAATSAGLIGMVTSYTMGPKWADREARMQQLNNEAAQLRSDALSAADDDVAAFSAVGAAYRLPKETSEQKATRRTEIQQALIQAAKPPAKAGRLAVRLVEIAGELVSSGNPNVLSDVAVASSTARAAMEAAIVNIEINRQQIDEEAEVTRLDSVVKELTVAMEAANRVVDAVREKLQR